MTRKARQRISYGQRPQLSMQGTKLTYIASATPGEFACGTPFGGQWPRDRHRSLDSVNDHRTENCSCGR